MYLNKDLKKQINDVLNAGGVVAFVTDTVWGLGCLPSSKKGVKKIYEIKKREAVKPLILMSNDVENLLPYVKPLGKKAKELIEKHFPGALTLVLGKTEKAPDYMTSGFNTVGIRVPDNAVFKEICNCIEGNVLATTSANLSHQPSSKTYQQTIVNMSGLTDLIIEDFDCKARGLESTVAMISGEEVKILRQGAIDL